MTDRLAIGYRHCARLTRAYGTTYYWGAAMLPPSRRRHVHAVYALCRLADDIVDATDADEDPARTSQLLERFRQRFQSALADPAAADPMLAAVADTVHRCGIEHECFDRFFTAMARDLVQHRYRTWSDLCDYMEGSAAVIGEMMLPVLQPLTPAAREPARALGFAFQLTNFLRDVAEDLELGRVYLPEQDLQRYDVDLSIRRVTPQWRRLMAFQIARNRDLYDQAAEGIAMLPPASARCVATAHILYSGILERIEAADYDVFAGRVAVPTPIKITTATRILAAGPPRSVVGRRPTTIGGGT